jgi:hypothetical protein
MICFKLSGLKTTETEHRYGLSAVPANEQDLRNNFETFKTYAHAKDKTGHV